MRKKQFIKYILKNWIKKILPLRYYLLLKTIGIKLLIITKKDLDYLYDEDFATTSARNKPWVNRFCELILRVFNPESVIDFGCGSGDILFPFEEKGIEVLGIDGSSANRNHSKIKKENFLLFDIRNKYKCKKKYDLCLCLEVAEHLEEKYSNILISNLAQSSSIIVFTVEPLEGVGHINLKPYEWWIKKFEEVNFNFDRNLTDYLKQEMQKILGIDYWYIRNLLIFKLAI
jgi:SAM-dependent methyltransferase